MKIEFHTPEGQIKKWVLEFLRFNLIDFYHSYKNISRAEVYFREDEGQENKICEIQLSIFGDSLFFRQHAATYEHAAQEVLYTMREKVYELVQTAGDLPERIVTTVKV